MTSRAVMSTRMAIPFLRNVSRASMAVDVNRHCVDLRLSGHKGDSGTLRTADLTTLKDVIADDCASVVISWPVSEYGATKRPSKTILQTLESSLRESHDNVTTTSPFYMLDGGGRRMASLTLLRSPIAQSKREDSWCAGEQDWPAPGSWLKHYSNSRSISLS
jgi:hypothetical protein